MSIDYKNLSIEELDAKLLECDAQIAELYNQRRHINNFLYDKGKYEEVKHLIGKYIIMPGYYAWDSEIPLEADYILCKVEELKQPVSCNAAYFKLSHFIHVKHAEATYDDEKLNIAFLKDDELDNYEIHDINKCIVLTDEEYNQKLEKIKEEFSKEFEKLKQGA